MWAKIAAAFLACGFLTACDKNSDTTRVTTPSTVPTAIGPTTQQLLNAPRVKLNLKFAPYTLQVPPSWEIKTYNEGNLVILQGPTPTDFVSISVPIAKSISIEQEKVLEEDARQQAAKYTDLFKGPPVRSIPGAKVIEQLTVDNSAVTGEPVQTLQWTFAFCVPKGKQYTVDELRFVGMTTQQYKTDQSFLRSIIDTAEFVPTPIDSNLK